MSKNNESSIFKHSSIMLAATITSKIFSYVFYFLMARLLTPEEYGILGALMSFFFIATVFTQGLRPVIAKFAAEFHEKDETGKLKTLLLTASRKLGFYGAIGFFLVFLSSSFISSFLHIPTNTPVIIVGIAFAFSAVLVVARGMLQGIGDFLNLGVNLSLETALRVLFGGLLVFFGLGVDGAVLALALAILVCIFSGIIPLRFLSGKIREKINATEIYTYSFPVIITSFAIVAMLNIDVILVKHYFDARIAGYYAAASLLAKVPLIFVRESLTPVIFTHAAKSDGGKEILKEFFIYSSFILVPLILIYWMIPEFLVKILYGIKYLQASEYMKWLVLPMAVMGINTLIINYLLAKERIYFVKYLLAALLLEVVLIALFHSTVYQVIAAVGTAYMMLCFVFLSKK